MRDSAGQRPERFELARSQPLGFRFLALAYVAKENRNAAVAWIGMDFVPNSSAGIDGFEFDRNPVGHHLFVIPLENGTHQRRKALPKQAAQDVLSLAAHHGFRFGIDVGHFPLRIDREESIRGLL